MAIEKMSLVRFYGPASQLDTVLPLCLSSGCFHPERPAVGGARMGSFAPLSADSPYSEILNRLKDMADSAGVNLDPELNELLRSPFLKVRFGTLPEVSEKLLDAGDSRYIYGAIADGGDGRRFSYYITTDRELPVVEDIFQGLGFETMGEPVRFTPVPNESPYRQILGNMRELGLSAGLSVDAISAVTDGHAPPVAPPNQDELDEFFDGFRAEYSRLASLREQLTKLLDDTSDALKFIEHFGEFNENLDSIFASKYYKMRFGRLPKGSFSKLHLFSDKLFMFFSLSEDERYHWGFFVTTSEDYAETNDIFNSLYFETVRLPDSVHGTPEAARATLRGIIEQTERDIVELDAQTSKYVKDNEHFFVSVYNALRQMDSTYALRKYVGTYGEMFHMEGFVPTSEQTRFSALFDGIPELEITFQPHDADLRVTAPTKLKNNRLWRPFETFVGMYGLPGYTEFDPTAFLAVTYTLLFGIMFGDLGQGIVVALVGLFLSKVRGMAFGGVLTRIGCSSAVFGLLYGSFFGLEHALDPLYRALGFAEKPLDVMEPLTINTLLIVAIALGAVLIVVTMLLNIYQGIKNHDIERAVFSNNGAAGLVFYGGLLAAVVCRFTGGPNLLVAWYVVPVLIVPILVIFLKESLGRVIHHHGGIVPDGVGVGGWIVEGFFELFEVVLSFVTNTLSFLRVGGFVISHAGMMMVVLTLSGEIRSAQSVIVLIIGNAFVIALEGFIVGIQVLRLQFYELFSHYYEGQGKPFTPIGA